MTIGKPPTGGNFSATQDIQLRTILAFSEEGSELKGQDQQYHIEMTQLMLSDHIHEGELRPLSYYVTHYLDSVENVDEFLSRVENRIQDGL